MDEEEVRFVWSHDVQHFIHEFRWFVVTQTLQGEETVGPLSIRRLESLKQMVLGGETIKLSTLRAVALLRAATTW